MHQVIPGTMKPRIRKQWGMWHCGGVAGTSPSDAYMNWKTCGGSLMKRAQEAWVEQNRQRERDDWLAQQKPIDWIQRYYQQHPLLPLQNAPIGPPWVITCNSPNSH